MELSPHRHSGKVQPHHHTSYGALILLLGFVGVILVAATSGLGASTQAGSGTLSVGTLVQTPPPTQPPTILAPANGAKAASNQITVSGGCRSGLLVGVQSNQTSVGSTPCDNGGTFSLTVSLTPGTNQLVAFQYDGLGQSSPPSAMVLVTYPLLAATGQAARPGLIASPGSTPNLRLYAPYRFPYIEPGDSLQFTGDLEGGTAPFAIQIDWGDKAQSLLSRVRSGIFTDTHNYSLPGTYTIKLTGTDSAGDQAFYQTVLVVNGLIATPRQPTAPSVTDVEGYGLFLVWPLFGVLVLLVISFWLGERYDQLRVSATTPPPQ